MDTYFHNHPDMTIFCEHGPVYQCILEDLLDSRLATGDFTCGVGSFVHQYNNNLNILSAEEDASPSPMSESADTLSQPEVSPTVIHKQSATALQAHTPTKQPQRQQQGWMGVLADSINDFGQQMVHSSAQMNESFKSTSE